MTDQATRDVLTNHSLSSLTSARGKGRAALLGIPELQDKLSGIAGSPDCDTELRFKAFESLFAVTSATLPPDLDDAVAEVYAAVLESGAYPNRFGLPYDVQSSATSRRLIARGERALARLAPLLDHGDPLAYEGSEEATIATMHGLRVKDLAAALIAAILSVPFAEEPDPKRRDQGIADLRGRIAAED